MIIDFSVENFRSIKELQTLSMSAANIVSKHKEVDEQNLIKVYDKLSLLKTKAIYGANASGKSNIIKALDSFIGIVVNSVKDDTILKQHIRPFKFSTETENKPSYFQLTFLLNDIQYRYGFEATRNEIIAEWLFGSPGKKEVFFFTRNGKNIEINERQFKEGIKVNNLFEESENNIARANSLFLTSVKSFNSGLAKNIVDFIDRIIVSGVVDFGFHMFPEKILDEKYRMFAIDLLKISDIGINDIKNHEFSVGNLESTKFITTLTEHSKYDANLNKVGIDDLILDLDESEGSKKLFEISPLLFKAIKENHPIIIDEFDARLHPLLTKKIVELFNSDTNKSSQLIFATHDTNLLDARLLRRDQICFVEKDKYGASHFYTLAEFKGVRNDASFEKDYIAGRYGAIPFLGDFNSIIEG